MDEHATIGLDAGPIGRWTRAVTGVALLLYALTDLVGGGHEARYYRDFLITFAGTLVAYVGADVLLGERLFARSGPWVATTVLLGPLVAVWAFGIGPPALTIALVAYVGASLIATAAIAYGGCEVAAIPSLMTGRRYRVYCPFNAVDAIERAASRTDD